MCAKSVNSDYTFINLLVSLPYLPRIWNESYIIPLHKKGSRMDIKNYRGIAKVSYLLQHLCSSLISHSQHGFVGHWSKTIFSLLLALNENLTHFLRPFANSIKLKNSAPEISNLFDSFFQTTYSSKPYNTTTPHS